MRQLLGPRNHETTEQAVVGTPAVAWLGIVEFLNGYGFLLLSHDPWEWWSLGVGKLCSLQHSISMLILALVMGQTLISFHGYSMAYIFCVLALCYRTRMQKLKISSHLHHLNLSFLLRQCMYFVWLFMFLQVKLLPKPVCVYLSNSCRCNRPRTPWQQEETHVSL